MKPEPKLLNSRITFLCRYQWKGVVPGNIEKEIITRKFWKRLLPENHGKDYIPGNLGNYFYLEIPERITTWKSRKGLLPENLGKHYYLEI